MSNERIMAAIDSLAAVLTTRGAVQRNSRAWPCWGKKTWAKQHYVAADYNDEISHIKQWLLKRLAWMDEQLEFEINN